MEQKTRQTPPGTRPMRTKHQGVQRCYNHLALVDDKANIIPGTHASNNACDQLGPRMRSGEHGIYKRDGNRLLCLIRKRKAPMQRTSLNMTKEASLYSICPRGILIIIQYRLIVLFFYFQ